MKVRALLKAGLAIVEIVAVFLGAMVAGSALMKTPFARDIAASAGEPVAQLLFRWSLVLLAIVVVERLVHRNWPAAWGLMKPWGGGTASPATLLALLVMAAPPALLFQSGTAVPEPTLAAAVGFVIPLIGQELLLLGFGHRRLSDVLPPAYVAGIMAVLFVLTHVQHFDGKFGSLVFLAAMAWQGMWWSLARSAGTPLTLLMAAHLLLLVAYPFPLTALAILALLALVFLRSWTRALAAPAPETATLPVRVAAD